MRHVVALVLFAFTLVACDIQVVQPDDPTPALPPVIHSFTADATRLLTPLLDTYLRWDVTGSPDTHCRIDSFNSPSQNIGNVPLGGFAQVRPGISREYVLSCTNTGGSVLRTVAIIVG